MNARTFFSSALPLAGLSVIVLGSRSSSQEPRVPDTRVLVDGFQLGQPANRILIDDTPPPVAPVILPVNPPPQPASLLPDGTEVRNHIIGTLIFENESRAVTPAFQFDTARPLVVEYMELHGRLAERLTDEQLETEIAELRQRLQVLDADDELKDIRSSLQRLIESHPETPAAESAQRALDQLEAEDQIPDGGGPFFDPGGSKPDSGNRRFDPS